MIIIIKLGLTDRSFPKAAFQNIEVYTNYQWRHVIFFLGGAEKKIELPVLDLP